VSAEAAAPRTLTLPPASTEMGAALELALAACDEADTISMASFRRAIDVSAKPDASFVTAADMAVEDAVRRRIGVRFPHHGLVGEEHGALASESGRRWIIDPIDGTHNYLRGVPVFATLLALEVDGRLALGCVSAPALGRRWLAWQGGGAWAMATGPGHRERGGAVPIGVSMVDSLDAASIVYSSVPSILASGQAPGFLGLLETVWRDRGLGDFYGYMLVAEGAAEAMIEDDLKLWDLAAPRAILEEAGARVTDLAGGDDIPERGVIASNGVIHELVLAKLQGA
jgi:histidinol-phosphatase